MFLCALFLRQLRGRLQAVPESQEAVPGNLLQEVLQQLEAEQAAAGGNQAQQQQQAEEQAVEQLHQLAKSMSPSLPMVPPPPPPKKAAEQVGVAQAAAALGQPPPPLRSSSLLSSSMPVGAPPPPPPGPPPRRLQSQDAMSLQQFVQQSQQAVNVLGGMPASSGAVQLIPLQAAVASEPGSAQWMHQQQLPPMMLTKEEDEHVLQSCGSLVTSSAYHPDTPSHLQTRSSSEWSRTLSNISSTLSGMSSGCGSFVGSYSSPYRLAAKPHVAPGGVVATALTTQQVVDLQREGILPQPPPPPPKQVGSTDYQAWKQHQQQHQVMQQQQLLELLQKHQIEQHQHSQQQKQQQVMVQQAEQAQLMHMQALDASNEELLQLQPMQLVDLSQQQQLQQVKVQQIQVAQHQQAMQHHQLLQLQGASMEGLRQGPPQELMQGSGMGVWSLQPTGLRGPVAGVQEQQQVGVQQVAVQNTPQTLEEAYAWVMAKNGSEDEPQLQRQQGVQLVQLVGVQDGMRARSDQLAVQAQQQQHQQHQQLTMLQRLMQAGASPELEEAVLKLHSM